MHGLIIRSFESFLRNTYGNCLWGAVVGALDAGVDRFEPMFHYDDALARGLLDGAANRLGKPAEALLEDFGTYLVAHPASERVRRLLRFGGVDFEDFLASLEDLGGRARLAVPDLDLPDFEMYEAGGGRFLVRSRNACPEFAPVFRGLMRALADDYGALLMIDEDTSGAQGMEIVLRLLDTDFAEGRGFDLAQRTAG